MCDAPAHRSMRGTTRGVGRLSTEPVEEGVAEMCRVAACDQPEFVVGLVVLGVTATFLLAVGAVLSRLDEARAELASERSRTRAERDAFERFRRRVVKLEPSQLATAAPQSGGANVLAATGASSADGGGLAEARRAYRETVMSTPHYDEEYDESLAENVAEEFSGPVAGALHENGGALTPGLRTTLAGGARRASEERAEMLSRLETEDAAVAGARSTLEPAVEAAERVRDDDRSYDTFTDVAAEYDRLEWHADRVETLLSDRQSRVHDEEADSGLWYEYLYRSLSSPYPVLAAGTETLAMLEDAEGSLATTASRL